MHEAGIMQDALDLAVSEANKAGGSRVHRMRLRVGVLSGVVPEALRFAFESLAPGSPADGAQLEIEPVAAAYWCEPCAREFVAPDLVDPCPGCGNTAATLRRGLELELSTVEVS
jgi:hydrogenase nickel incorporation protein HypA/HybF